MTEATASGDEQPAPLSPEEFARVVAGAGDAELETAIEANREVVVAEIFRQMPDRLDPVAAAGVDLVFEWRIADGAGGEDRWQVIVRDGACEAVRDGDERPGATIHLSALAFVKLVGGAATGPDLFMRGDLEIEGDLLAAASAYTLFRIPSPG